MFVMFMCGFKQFALSARFTSLSLSTDTEPAAVSPSPQSASRLMHVMLMCASNQHSLSIEVPVAALSLSPVPSAVSPDDSFDFKPFLFSTSRFLPAGPDFGFEDFSATPCLDSGEQPYDSPFIPAAPRPAQTSDRRTRSARHSLTTDHQLGTCRSHSTSSAFSSIDIGANEYLFG